MVRSAPALSVVMPVHNGEDHVMGAVMSILRQSLRDLELLVVDDHSTDATANLLTQLEDPRIRLVPNEGPKGFSHALNLGIERAKGTYIARMDADDKALPSRLRLQLNFLEQHPDISFVGSGVALNDPEKGLRQDPSFRPASPGHLRWALLFYCALAHPTIVGRRSAFEMLGGYDPRFFPAEDYDLWVRALEVDLRLANLPDVLLHYRVNPSGMSHSPSSNQADVALSISKRALERELGKDVDLPTLHAIRQPASLDLSRASEIFRSAETLLHDSRQAARAHGLSPNDDLAISRHAQLMADRLAWYALRTKPSLLWRNPMQNRVATGRGLAYAIRRIAGRLRSSGTSA